MIRSAAILISILFLTAAPRASADEAKPKKRQLTFQQDVLPIFRARCIRCHAGVEPKGGLNLTQPSSLLGGGESGAAIRIAAAEFSLLYEKIASNEMPASGPKLSAKEKGIIRTWINQGAKGVGNAKTVSRSDDLSDVELWSFQPPRRPPLPEVAGRELVANPIDAFVLKKLEQQQLTFAPQADRLTLLRRATFDLIGLPPTPAQVRQFMADQRPGSFQRMVDRLLASPQYGERWGRHWLDLAGYADSAGILSEDRPLPLIYRYRDYVIRAFNQDKPYDRFLQEQIAGDELTDYWSAFEKQDRLPEMVVDGITATGFLRTAADPSRPDFKTIKNAAAQYYYPTLFDTLQIVCSSTMGLTVQCARCHSHKFDPIPQVDYYRMQAVFMNAYRPEAWVPQMNRRLKVASKKQLTAAKARNSEIDRAVKKANAGIAVLRKQFGERLFSDRLDKLPAEVRESVAAAFQVAAKKRSARQKALVAKHQKQLRPTAKALDAALQAAYGEFKTKTSQLRSKISAELRQRPAFDEIRALYDLQGSAKTPVLLRGDPLTPGPYVPPGVISTMKTPQPFRWTAPPKDARSSGRRLAFAKWLTQPRHPLTSRVMVNRIWSHHFQAGIVSTPEDFGTAGAPPSHPQLLDWLAVEFVRSGWRVKHMHRLILSSRTWRQRSNVSQAHLKAAAKVDPDNRLLWRQSLRRLEAEPFRDSVLAASGLLDSSLYGSPQSVRRLKSGEVVTGNGQGLVRRSIYVQVLRLNPETMLEMFDQPEIAINCTRRNVSTVSTQALTLLNSDLMVRSAAAFAARVRREMESDDAVTTAVRIAFSRLPTKDERIVMTDFLKRQTARHLDSPAAKGGKTVAAATARRQALTDLCHMLLSANEFAYID